MNTMMQGYIEMKVFRGFNKLPNGLYEDCIGTLYRLDIKQENTKDINNIDIINISVKMIAVN